MRNIWDKFPSLPEARALREVRVDQEVHLGLEVLVDLWVLQQDGVDLYPVLE